MNGIGVNADPGLMVAPGGRHGEAAGRVCDPAASKSIGSAAGQPATRTASASPISEVVRAGLPWRSVRSAVTASSIRAASAS